MPIQQQILRRPRCLGDGDGDDAEDDYDQNISLTKILV